jgi:hypothetical protein
LTFKIVISLSKLCIFKNVPHASNLKTQFFIFYIFKSQFLKHALSKDIFYVNWFKIAFLVYEIAMPNRLKVSNYLYH